MLYEDIFINSIGYELPSEVITTDSIDEAMASAYQALYFPAGQLEKITGIRERRWWPRGFKVSDGAILAAKKALSSAGLTGKDVDVLVYAGVCRDNQEPATACRVGAGIGVLPEAALFDLSNACLGAINAMIEVSNRIALGQARIGLVVCCESSRDLSEDALTRFLTNHDMDFFKMNFATFTGGSGAAAIVLSADPKLGNSHRLLGGIAHNSCEFNELCTWGYTRSHKTYFEQALLTDSVGVLNHGIELGLKTWVRFLEELKWNEKDVDKIISHQVGVMHRKTFLKSLNMSEDKDYPTYPNLGNIASVSLPLTAAIADENQFLKKGDKVALLGFGSGLNCLMMGVEW